MTSSARGGGDQPTRIIGSSKADDERTKILDDERMPLQPRRRDVPGTLIGPRPDDETRFTPPGLGDFDPVVAFLIVTKGPGKGQYRGLHYGQNSIGRDPSQRVSLDFGDARISRDAHAYIVYDEARRAFFLRDNGKSNVVRLGGEIVMTPTELRDRDEIIIGNTTLMFVPLCDSRFDWLASNEQPSA